MKKMMVMAMMMAMSISANAMSYSVARNEALFLSDKMAYELGLNGAQYDAVYEINLDYLMSMNGQGDVFGIWWSRRNSDLSYVLSAWQYNKYMACSYFYRPLVWNAGKWQFGIYRHYSNRGLFYMSRPAAYASYKGGNNHRSARYYAALCENGVPAVMHVYPVGEHGFGIYDSFPYHAQMLLELETWLKSIF